MSSAVLLDPPEGSTNSTVALNSVSLELHFSFSTAITCGEGVNMDSEIELANKCWKQQNITESGGLEPRNKAESRTLITQ
jgi:hypothetical protein